ncbi:MAG: hypothetical protein K6A80_01535 [Saccharofermentans sp.]|nr:hypothetical protein [Saccharofermentans sp.]
MSVLKAKDTMRKAPVQIPKLTKLKGKVSVQLFNAETGELEQETEGENLVTNVIANSFASNYCGVLHYDLFKPIKDVFFGGILCFQSPLTEVATNMYPPISHDNPVVAHAGQTTYSSADADSTRGLPNDIESGRITGGYKWVWDFPATQGNGTISALAMTNKDVGDMWLGASYTGSLNGNSPDTTRGASTLMPVIFDDTNGIAYAFYTSGSTLTVRKFTSYGSIEGVGLFETPLDEKNLTDNSDYTDYTYTISNITRGKVLYYNGNIHVLVPNTSSISRVIIDTSDMSSTSDTINLSGVTLDTSTNTVGNGASGLYLVPYELTDDGYLVMAGTDKVYFINYTNSADVRSINLTATKLVGVVALGKWAVIIPYTDQNIAYYTDGYTYRQITLYAYDSTGSWAWAMFYRGIKQIDSPIRIKALPMSNNTGKNAVQAELFKQFLSTVKNLDNAVTKTATQTMKITYSITEVQEGE